MATESLTGYPPPDKFTKPTSTQIGAIGEALIAAGILVASNGRLSPFKPMADDDGMDLLLFDKFTRKATPLQIKSRTKFDNEPAQNVQFDIRLKTFAEEGYGYVLCALLDGTSIKYLWLFSALELQTVARRAADKLRIVPSAREATRDKFAPFRMPELGDVVQRMISVGRS